MIRIAICDDEEISLHHTQTLLNHYALPVKVEAYKSGESLLSGHREQLLAGTPYQIIILDINMASLSGIETAKYIRQYDKEVKLIYATNYSDYTTFAFGVHAFAYLLKPLTSQMLYQQLDEAIEYSSKPIGEPFTFQTSEGILRLPLEQVLYFEYVNRLDTLSRCVLMHTENRQSVLKQRLSDVVDTFSEKGFAMPHKSFLVNLKAVKAIQGYDLHLVNGAIVPLSQKKSQDFRRRLNQFLSFGGGLR